MLLHTTGPHNILYIYTLCFLQHQKIKHPFKYSSFHRNSLVHVNHSFHIFLLKNYHKSVDSSHPSWAWSCDAVTWHILTETKAIVLQPNICMLTTSKCLALVASRRKVSFFSVSPYSFILFSFTLFFHSFQFHLILSFFSVSPYRVG
jgi:hypothetical protein